LALKGAHLSEFLYGKIEVPEQTLVADDKKTQMPNPKFAIYIAKQQQVLNFLFSSLSKDMLELVAAYSTPEEVWENLMTMASSQSQAHVVNTRMAHSTTRKGTHTIAQYVGKMKALTDDMASAGKKLDDEELVGYTLASLVSEFDSMISVVAAHVEPISMSELYGQLIYHNQRRAETSEERILHDEFCIQGS
jgi:hypothetical protein